MPDMTLAPRETMDCDVLIVGAGPAGLAAAIRLKQLAAAQAQDISVIVLEKGSEPGAHILSGAVMDPRAMNELMPDWQQSGCPMHQAVTQDEFLFLSKKSAWRTPHFLLPTCLNNQGNYIVSLSNVTRWMATQAEALGVDIFSGFAGAHVLYKEDGSVQGVATGDQGIGKDGQPTARFARGMELRAKYTLFAEGSRGHLGRQLIEHFKLDANCDPQSYALGIKELWQVDPAQHQAGLVLHSAGWPLDNVTYGGGFVYHLDKCQVVVGLVVGLDYRNPWLSPFEEFQRFKTHPHIRRHLGFANSSGSTAKRLAYGARSITAGGLLSLPQTVFAGGALIGCEAGYLNASRIKGSHAAIKTGMLAAQAAFDALRAGRQNDVLTAYPQAFKQSWLHSELMRARNFKSWFKKGRIVGTVMTGVEQFVLHGHIPWTLHNRTPDHAQLYPAAQCQPIAYPKPDQQLTFDRLSSVFLSNTGHEENQPAHLTLKDTQIPTKLNLATYAGPEARYCPAGVYEFVPTQDGEQRLQINAANCIHCKTCDIKDPRQNIVWVTPEGGGGPNYSGM